jgi:hypothetical protein
MPNSEESSSDAVGSGTLVQIRYGCEGADVDRARDSLVSDGFSVGVVVAEEDVDVSLGAIFNRQAEDTTLRRVDDP